MIVGNSLVINPWLSSIYLVSAKRQEDRMWGFVEEASHLEDIVWYPAHDQHCIHLFIYKQSPRRPSCSLNARALAQLQTFALASVCSASAQLFLHTFTCQDKGCRRLWECILMHCWQAGLCCISRISCIFPLSISCINFQGHYSQSARYSIAF